MTEFNRDVHRELREAMVAEQIEARGIEDERVLQAMREVPRHLFVLPAYSDRAYDDTPLAIKEGQTISQPYIVAWMSELLRLEGDETVLEIGTGSGYQTAVLARLAGFVYSIERIPELARTAVERLADPRAGEDRGGAPREGGRDQRGGDRRRRHAGST